ncbi:hypothetical protein LZ575_03195 [Antarcticibacterium sp. 1MA-6-2]|uniref:hypothetical protein n=1 Tax=Antarcticibacterium sp. 1MA-6-2 TaxID=2908210 RepID=UPI001F19AE7D|nr:hypothetical protein [Antarcticibacterium sp. 1MA-6-2]UJH91707.1 hypothetical protein LZ575_03195 [Antarcticibacterium sp. 1MA-6-2]
MIVALELQAQKGFFEVIGERFEEGGFFIMMMILLVFLLGIFLLIRGIYFARKKILKLPEPLFYSIPSVFLHWYWECSVN